MSSWDGYWLKYHTIKYLVFQTRIDERWAPVNLAKNLCENPCLHSQSGTLFVLHKHLKASPFRDTDMYYVEEKNSTISLLNNSEKLVQILLEFSQQIVEGYELVLARFRWKDVFSQPKSAN